MKKKESYFGGAELFKGSEGNECLNISCFNDGEIKISDTEILDNGDSPEVVIMEHENSFGERREILIHKKDLLPLATFLLHIHNEYAERHNEIDFEYFRNSVSNL